MRVASVIVLAAGLLVALTACTGGPPFTKITEIKVRHIGPGGLTDKMLSPDLKRQAINCLNQTREVRESETLRDLLQTTYLLEISDNAGDRSFELYTARNLKGNKGKYYENNCIHKLIRDQ